MPLMQEGEILRASTEGGVDNSTDNHTLGIIWTNHLSEADYVEAVKLWQNRVVMPPLDADLLQSVMERFECMHKMESVTLSSEIPFCSEATVRIILYVVWSTVFRYVFLL